MEEELTLRDIADILARYRAWLIALPLAGAAGLFTVGTLLPRTYASEAAVSVTQEEGSLLSTNLLPGARAMAEKYSLAAPGRLAGTWNTNLETITKAMGVVYDEKSDAITLSAKGETPVVARQRAELMLNDFAAYMDGLVGTALVNSLESQKQRALLDVAADTAAITKLRAALRDTPAVLPGSGQSSLRDAMQSAGVDRRFTGNADTPANPAHVLLSVRIAEAQARIAQTEANLARLDSILGSTAQQAAVVRQAMQIQRLAEANVPVTPEGVGRSVLAVLGFLLGGLLAVLGAFVHHALQPAPRVQGSLTGQASREPAPVIAQQGD